jgi:hypothetical protein
MPDGLQGMLLNSVSFYALLCPAEHEVLPVSEGHRVTLTYNLRALHKQAEPAVTAHMTPQDATKLAAVEQMVAADNVARPKAGSSDMSSSGSDNTTWMTAADVSASAELAAELQAAMADKTWHPEGEGLCVLLAASCT